MLNRPLGTRRGIILLLDLNLGDRETADGKREEGNVGLAYRNRYEQWRDGKELQEGQRCESSSFRRRRFPVSTEEINVSVGRQKEAGEGHTPHKWEPGER